MDIMIFAIPVFFLLIGTELLVARIHQQQLYRFNDAVSNISCGISQQVTGIFIKAFTLLMYTYIYLNWSLFDIPNTWWSYIILFIAVDCLYYWFHRYSHEISLLWGAHTVHHQSEDYNLSVALRQSALQPLFSGFFYLPLAFLGFDPIPFMLINTIQTLYQFWIHTELIDRMPKWFEFIFASPSHHRVHHGRNPKYIDKNHGGTLIVFDRMFGTFQEEEEPVVYGVTKPLATWSPFWANLDYYNDLGGEMGRTPSLWDKIKLLVKKPGWRTKANGGPHEIPKITRDTQTKYHTIIPNGLTFYILVQYIFVLSGATLFLATIPKQITVFTIPIVASVILIVLSVTSLGLSADKKRSGFWLEIIRLVIIPILLHLFFLSKLTTTTNGLYITFGIVVIHSLSIVYYWRFKKILNL